MTRKFNRLDYSCIEGRTLPLYTELIRSNFRRLYLSTFAELDPARHLYEKFGFVLAEEQADNHWGKTATEQTFELSL
ncbi:MAG: hypothetical protein A2170_03180 [Deltaproteobacteria bacterium RBG_13_53_10]|nr:MAG: hypothetical protein A2170_03180 [Deltaproteobacteria bacterium RBG_13_53_10]